MSYEHVEEEVIKLLKKYWVRRIYVDPRGTERIAEPRVVSLDLETAPLKSTDFLSNERILAIAVAKRISGEFTSAEGIEVKSWLLSEDSDLGEYELLREFNEGLRPEPLGVIGFGIRDYDLPLLSIKMERYNPDINEVKSRIPHVKKLWHIINTLERAIHLDLMTRLQFELNVSGFDKVLDHQKFLHLPLKRIKHLARPKEMSMGEHNYIVWKNQPEFLRALVEAHAYDVLLIAEWEFFNPL